MSSPAIDPIFGPTANSHYWSATALTVDFDLAWYVNFFGGGLENGRKSEVRRVRAVRTAF